MKKAFQIFYCLSFVVCMLVLLVNAYRVLVNPIDMMQFIKTGVLFLVINEIFKDVKL